MYLNLSPEVFTASASARLKSRAAASNRLRFNPYPPFERSILASRTSLVDDDREYLIEPLQGAKRCRTQSGDRPLFNLTKNPREVVVKLSYSRVGDSDASDLVPRVGTLEQQLARANLETWHANFESWRANLRSSLSMEQCSQSNARQADQEWQLESARRSQHQYMVARTADEGCSADIKVELRRLFDAAWPSEPGLPFPY